MSDKYHVAAINFEAGDHAIPQNPLEIDLALGAAKVAWENIHISNTDMGNAEDASPIATVAGCSH